MDIRQYLPSAKFVTLVGAIAFSVALIYGAEAFDSVHHLAQGTLQGVPGATSNTDWQAALNAAQAQVDPSGVSAVEGTAQHLVSASQTGNLTETIGRSILINTTAAAGQGNASDSAVQGEIVNEALAQVQPSTPSRAPYTQANLTVIPDSPAALHDWGNIVVATFNAHPQATYKNTMLQVSLAVDSQSSTTLEKLPAIANDYEALAHDLMSVPVPQSAAADDLTLANTFLRMAAACRDMQGTLSDPARALAGLQAYNTLYSTELSVFTQSAQLLQRNGILFNSSEPGYELSTFSGS